MLYTRKGGSTMKLSKNVFITVTILLVLSICLIFFVAHGTPWGMANAKASFRDYLEAKYDSNFLIKELSFDVMHGAYHATAYEVSEPELLFYVGENIADKKISDAYDIEKITQAAQADVTAIIDMHLSKAKISVELISLQAKELEINVWTEYKVEESVKEKILEEIINNGYLTNQLIFNRD